MDVENIPRLCGYYISWWKLDCSSRDIIDEFNHVIRFYVSVRSGINHVMIHKMQIERCESCLLFGNDKKYIGYGEVHNQVLYAEYPRCARPTQLN